jgi:hypothetical protein
LQELIHEGQQIKHKLSATAVLNAADWQGKSMRKLPTSFARNLRLNTWNPIIRRKRFETRLSEASPYWKAQPQLKENS